MTILDKITIAAGVELVPIQEVNDLKGLKDLEYNEDDFVLNKARARTRSKIISKDLALFLKYFEEPVTIVGAVIQFSAATLQNPKDLLPQVHPFIYDLLNLGFLVYTKEDKNEPLFKVGDEFEGYTIRKNIHKVIDTEIYEASSLSDKNEFVIIKIGMEAKNNAISFQFENEAVILESLPNAINPRLLKTGRHEGNPYLIIEKVANIPITQLAKRLREKSDYHALLDILKNIVHAYIQLHRAGIYHVDINPRNILITPDKKIYIIDYGMSMFVDSAGKRITGIESFSPPESMAISDSRNSQKWDAYCEQYSIAAILYHLFTGRHCIDFSHEIEIMRRQLLEQPPLTFAQQNLAPFDELEQILLKALNKGPGKRYQNLEEMLVALDAIRENPYIVSSQSHYSLLDLPLYDLTDDLIEKLMDEKTRQTFFNRSPCAPIFTGGAGVAYFLYRHAMDTQSPELLALADVWINRSREIIYEKNAYRNNDIGFIEKDIEKVSLFNHEPGIHFVQALISSAQGDAAMVSYGIEQIIKLSGLESKNVDMTMGKTGILLGLAGILESAPGFFNLDMKAIIAFGNFYLDKIWNKISTGELIKDDFKIKTTGIAHGWAGLLYASLRWYQVTSGSIPAFIEPKLKELYNMHDTYENIKVMKSSINSRSFIYMPGWCNGGAGLVELYTLAGKIYNNSEYVAMAEAFAVDVNTNKSDFGDLCCGLTGRAYSLLSLYNATLKEKYYDQARQLLKRSKRATYFLKTDSLFKGKFGQKLLELEIDNPATALFPCL